MSDIDWPKHLKAALDATEFMALATRGPEGLWNHAVYFAYDQDINIYFISQPGSRHMQNIVGNHEVALAIYRTNQQATGDVVGLQIKGHSEVLPDSEVPVAHHIYYARSSAIPGIPSDPNAYFGDDAEWKFVKVKPGEIGYFDTENFGGVRQTVPQGVRI